MVFYTSTIVDEAKRKTSEWAAAAGYVPAALPPPMSKKARDVYRILSTASFGCQGKAVKMLCEALLEEKLPEPAIVSFQYGTGLMPPLGVVLVTHTGEVGIAARYSNAKNVGLRMADGSMPNNHFAQRNVRPANDEEINAFFEQWFSVPTGDAPARDEDDDVDS